jgi:hypothetical protein
MCIEPQRASRRRLVRNLAFSLVLALTAACATRVAPPTLTTLAHPEFLYPQLPVALAASPGASRP